VKNRKIQVYSEIGPLKEVLLHRPGAELENLTPDYLEEFLFDDIPFLKVAQQEHDVFADILRKAGVEVTYVRC
jgi:arginine deiminase